MFGFEEEAVPSQAPASSQAAGKVPPEWLERAVEACFSSQKTRWRALTEAARIEVAHAMWSYAQARTSARANPLRAAEAEASLRGWLMMSPLAGHLRILHAHLVNPADIRNRG
jgi:hypothetical protein